MRENSFLDSIRHIFKLDPNRPISEQQIERICQSNTDALVIGGTLGITYEDTAGLLKKVRKYGSNKIIIQEISNLDAIVPGFDYYFIPLVLNAQNPTWILEAHHKAIKKYGELINWGQVLIEGYVVLNKDSSVAKLTDSKTSLSVEDAIAYARMADKMLGLPIFYIEYSGMYGDVNLLREVKEALEGSRLFYGGGIASDKSAVEMSRFADTIVVGNLIYENFESALNTTNIIEKKI